MEMGRMPTRSPHELSLKKSIILGALKSTDTEWMLLLKKKMSAAAAAAAAATAHAAAPVCKKLHPSHLLWELSFPAGESSTNDCFVWEVSHNLKCS